jgi:glycine hydroxymethyltransferase
MSVLPGNKPLAEIDPEMAGLVVEEKLRQKNGLELIASENFTSRAVMEALGSCLTNKYSEGLPHHRYYGGNEVIDKVENLCIERALKAFHLSDKDWGVNVQPYSGSVANFAALTAVLEPGDTVMGLALSAGGHLTHGHQSPEKKISATAIYFNSVQYGVDENGYVNYDEIDRLVAQNKPKLIIAGASAYPRDWDYKRMRKAADTVGAFLMADIAHISGLIAAEEHRTPFDDCHIVTTTTHKSLRGPRAAMIFFRKGETKGPNGVAYDLEKRVNFAVFPTMQGGPHENQIGAIAVALKEVMADDFKAYAKQVKSNMQALVKALIDLGYQIVTGGTENHLCLLNVRDKALTGSKVEKVCDLASITVNKNMIVGDKSALAPGGIRLGSPALTSRGLTGDDFKAVAGFIDRAIKIALDAQAKSGPKLTDWTPVAERHPDLPELKKQVEAFSSKFPIPGL